MMPWPCVYYGTAAVFDEEFATTFEIEWPIQYITRHATPYPPRA